MARVASAKAMAVAKKKFEREMFLVDLLMRRLGLSAERYIDPKNASDETGADVLAVVGGRQIGIQVTEVDTGDEPGRSRNRENVSWRSAQEQGQSTYGGWAQNDVRKLLAAIARAVASKAQHVVGCEEAWLLISAGVPELGTVVSTFIMTQWLGIDALNAATSSHLAKCKYNQVFLHAIVGGEGALYCWTAGGTWQKFTRQEPPVSQGPSFWDIKKSIQGSEVELLEWITDMDGKTDREISKCIQELRKPQAS